MSTQERPKDTKEDEKTTTPKDMTSSSQDSSSQESSAEEWLDQLDPKTMTENTKQEKSESKQSKLESQKGSEIRQIDRTEELLKQFLQNLPRWLDKPWMYVKPTHDGHLQNWINGWKEIILSYSRTLAEHIINVYDLQRMHPFKNKVNQRQLSLDQIVFLIQEMVDENLAKWLDEEMMARIYYRSDKEWAQVIHSYLVETGMAAEVMTLYELRKLDEEWSELPESELIIVLDLLVDSNKARWVGSSKDAIKIEF